MADHLTPDERAELRGLADFIQRCAELDETGEGKGCDPNDRLGAQLKLGAKAAGLLSSLEAAEAEIGRLKSELVALENPAHCVVIPGVTDEDVEAAWASWNLANDMAGVLNNYRARLAKLLPVWEPVEPGTVIKAGTRYRVAEGDGSAAEYVSTDDCTVMSTRVSIDRRTVPAPDPDAELVDAIARAACAEYGDDLDALDYDVKKANRETASAILAAIRETHAIEPKPKREHCNLEPCVRERGHDGGCYT